MYCVGAEFQGTDSMWCDTRPRFTTDCSDARRETFGRTSELGDCATGLQAGCGLICETMTNTEQSIATKVIHTANPTKEQGFQKRRGEGGGERGEGSRNLWRHITGTVSHEYMDTGGQSKT